MVLSLPPHPAAARRAWAPKGLRGAAAVVLGLTVLMGAACDRTTPAPDAGPTTTAAPATAPPTTRDTKADQKVARDALLRLDDLPGDQWNETKRSLSSEAEPSTADNPASSCPEAQAKVRELGLDRAAPAMTAKSSKFSLGPEDSPTAQLEETVEIRASVDEATSMANVFGDDALEQCLETEVKSTLGSSTSKGVTVDTAKIKVERLKVGSLGDDHAVFRVTLPAQSSGVSIDVIVVAAFVRVGRGYVNISYATYGALDVNRDVLPVLDASTARLKKALQT